MENLINNNINNDNINNNNNKKEETVMENNKIVLGATNNTEDKAFEEIERKVQESFAEIGREVQEKVKEIQDKEFIKEQEEMMEEVKEHNERYNKMVEEIEQERQEGLAEMKDGLNEYNKFIVDTEKEESKDEEIKEKANIYNFEGEEAKKIREQLEVNCNKIQEYYNAVAELSNLNETLVSKRLSILYNKIEKTLEDSKLNDQYYLERASNSECKIINRSHTEFVGEPVIAISGDITDMLIIFEMIKNNQ